MTAAPAPTLAEAFSVWLKIGCLGFGGPAGQIALLHREVVDERGWLTDAEFQHALGFCMLLPGPEAQQMATWLGWRLHGVRGGLVAGWLFVLPGLAIILALASAYVAFGRVPAAEAALLGVKAAVVAIVLEAIIRLSKRSLKRRALWITAGLALAAMTLLSVPFPFVILAAGLTGAFLSRKAVIPGPGEARTPTRIRTLPTAALWSALWLAPLLVALLALGPESMIVRLSAFFGALAAVTFGGAYAALAWTAQAADAFGWLRPEQMLDALGLSETTPGPLVLTLVFVAFVAAFQASPPALAWGVAIAAALLSAWAIFAPSFLWIFVGGPYLERIRRDGRLAGALAFISAAVVGVVANLALWFALHLLFREPVPPAGFVPHWGAIGLTALALLLTFRLHTSMLVTLGVCAVAGLVLHLV